MRKLAGPLSTIAILAAGFYSVPIVQGLVQGFKEGDVFGSVAESLANPTGK